jgi:hypothetical protein
MTTNFELWKQAIEQLTRVVAELDQAHATLKDCGLDDIAAGGYRKPTIKHLVSDAEGLLKGLQYAKCEECGRRIAHHGDRYGCEYERGDVEMPCRDGGTILAAAGPCGCEWGLQEPKGRKG